MVIIYIGVNMTKSKQDKKKSREKRVKKARFIKKDKQQIERVALFLEELLSERIPVVYVNNAYRMKLSDEADKKLSKIEQFNSLRKKSEKSQTDIDMMEEISKELPNILELCKKAENNSLITTQDKPSVAGSAGIKTVTQRLLL